MCLCALVPQRQADSSNSWLCVRVCVWQEVLQRECWFFIIIATQIYDRALLIFLATTEVRSSSPGFSHDSFNQNKESVHTQAGKRPKWTVLCQKQYFSPFVVRIKHSAWFWCSRNSLNFIITRLKDPAKYITRSGKKLYRPTSTCCSCDGAVSPDHGGYSCLCLRSCWSLGLAHVSKNAQVWVKWSVKHQTLHFSHCVLLIYASWPFMFLLFSTRLPLCGDFCFPSKATYWPI